MAELQKVEGAPVPLHERMGLTVEQLDLVQRTVAARCTNDELELFLHTAHRYELDPLLGEIHAIKRPRWNPDTKQYDEAMTIQVGIDGYRVLAERTGRYCPGPAARFEVRTLGTKQDLCCTFTVLKLVSSGVGNTMEWRPVEAVAWHSEYVQRTKQGEPNRIWRERPKGQLEKCAETLAIRRAFPRAVGGLRTHEEMAQADTEVEAVVADAVPPPPTMQPPPAALPQPERPAFKPARGARLPEEGEAPRPQPQPQRATYAATQEQRARLRGLMAATTPDRRKVFTAAELARVVDMLGACGDGAAYDKVLASAEAEREMRVTGWAEVPADNGAQPAAVQGTSSTAGSTPAGDDDLPF